MIPAFTNFPFAELGDRGLMRKVNIVGYDGERFATIEVGGMQFEVELDRLFKQRKRTSETFNVEDLAPFYDDPPA